MAKSTYYKVGNTPYIDMLFLSTWDKRFKTIEDQIFRDNPTLAWLDSIKDTEMIAGSEQFIVPLLVSENPNGGWISEEEGVSMDDFDPDDGATYWAKSLAYGIRWSRYEQRVNRGDSKRFSIIQHKEDVTILSIKKLLAGSIFTGTGGASKQMEGLVRLIPATVPASQTVSIGGISPSTKPWWRTQAINMSGIPATTGLEGKMLNMWHTIELETAAPDVIFTDQATEEIYETNAMSMMIVDSKTKIGDATFELVKWKGAPIIMDKLAPSGEMRMVTKKALKWCVDPEYYLKWTDSKEAVNLPITKFKQNVTTCQLVRTQARSLGCIYNIAANG